MEKTQETTANQELSHSHRRIQESQIFVLTRRLRDTMSQYNQESMQHRERCKKAIVRELEIGE
jgi:hypothetical protein